MSKGSGRRPAAVPHDVFAERWAATFSTAEDEATGTGEQLDLAQQARTDPDHDGPRTRAGHGDHDADEAVAGAHMQRGKEANC